MTKQRKGGFIAHIHLYTHLKKIGLKLNIKKYIQTTQLKNVQNTSKYISPEKIYKWLISTRKDAYHH